MLHIAHNLLKLFFGGRRSEHIDIVVPPLNILGDQPSPQWINTNNQWEWQLTALRCTLSPSVARDIWDYTQLYDVDSSRLTYWNTSINKKCFRLWPIYLLIVVLGHYIHKFYYNSSKLHSYFLHLLRHLPSEINLAPFDPPTPKTLS